MKYFKYISLALVLSLFACEDMFFEEEPKSDPESIFETVWQTFRNDYGGFESRNVDWQSQYDLYRPMVTASTSDEELYDILTEMVSVLGDGHVFLMAPNEQMYSPNKHRHELIDDELFDLKLIKEAYLEGKYTINGYEGNTFGKIGNIGYWHAAWVHANWLETNNILEEFADVDGLIIDLRHNGGGDFTYAFTEIGRLAEKETLAYTSRTKNGTAPNDFTEWYEWSIYPDGEFYNKPIIALIDKYTVSAGERTVLGFQALPNITLMGDSTNGSIATMTGKELANGWYFTLPIQEIRDFEGNDWEGPGIPPDIYSQNTSEQMSAGVDATLERAIEMLEL
ncbi:MAG: S41 family peptidase [Cyclobacteriaceae bacterium]